MRRQAGQQCRQVNVSINNVRRTV